MKLLDQKSRLLVQIIVISLFISLISTSYAFYLGNVKGNESALNNVIETGSVTINFSDGPRVSASNMTPGDYVEKTFTVKNTGTVDTIYSVYFSNLINTFINMDDLVYTLNSNGCSSILEKIVPNSSSVDSKLVDSCQIGAGESHEYTLRIEFKETDDNQINNMGEMFSSEIAVNTFEVKNIYAKLDKGSNVNIKMKTLAGDDVSSGNQTVDTNIYEIKIADSEPDSSNKEEKNLVSATNSSYPIYMWYDSHTIYIWSEALKIKTAKDSSNLFGRMRNIKSVDLSKLDTSDTTNMNKMFVRDISLESLDLTKFNTNKVTKMESFLYGCSSLKRVNLDDFVTEKTTIISSFFTECSSLEEISIKNWNTSNVENFTSIFSDCTSLRQIDVSSFDTSKATTMNGLFKNCSSLEVLDLRNFDTSKVGQMNGMFQGDSNLKRIYASSQFKVDALDFENYPNASQNMFLGDINLVGGKSSVYDASKVNHVYARISSNDIFGYFTSLDK